MAESRLQRWSRKKAKAGKDAELPTTPSAVEPEIEPSASSEEQTLAVNEALPEHELLEKYGLPDPDAIELGTDITGFMRKEIPELLRRRALRSLWKSNPVLAVLDGLNDYDEDFTDAANIGKGVQTLYKVGQGFDRTPAPDPQPAEHIEDQNPEQSEMTSDSEIAAEVEPEKTVDPVDPDSVDPEVTGHFEPTASTAVAAAETETVARYRPRMRFEY